MIRFGLQAIPPQITSPAKIIRFGLQVSPLRITSLPQLIRLKLQVPSVSKGCSAVI